jgi:hypothetical protein
MTNSRDTIGNRTREFPVSSAVPQPTAQPRAFRSILSTLLTHTTRFGRKILSSGI